VWVRTSNDGGKELWIGSWKSELDARRWVSRAGVDCTRVQIKPWSVEPVAGDSPPAGDQLDTDAPSAITLAATVSPVIDHDNKTPKESPRFVATLDTDVVSFLNFDVDLPTIGDHMADSVDIDRWNRVTQSCMGLAEYEKSQRQFMHTLAWFEHQKPAFAKRKL